MIDFGDIRLPPRFWNKVRISEEPTGREVGPCWLWIGSVGVRDGYVRWTVGSRKDGSKRPVLTHRSAYEALVAPVAADLQLDHLCRVRACCNPAHLEPVTPVVNTRRGVTGQVRSDACKAITHCPAGHPYDEANTYIVSHPGGYKTRQCKACTRSRTKEWRAKKRAEKEGKAA